MNVQINPAALQDQHHAHIERRRRFDAAARRYINRSRAPKPTLYNCQFDAHVAAQVAHMGLLDIIANGDATGAYARPTIRQVIDMVAEHYGVTAQDLCSGCRVKKYMIPRQVAMYLAKNLTCRSYPMIGAALGGRDHTTIMNGVQKIGRSLPDNAGLARDVAALRLKLIGGDDADAR